MLKLYILCGYPFAGKSTLARKLTDKFGFVHISVDEINTQRGIGLDTLKPIAPEEWQSTYKIFYERIVDNLRSGYTVVADAVAYHKKQRDYLLAIAKECNADAFVVYLKIPLETVKKRWSDNKATSVRPVVRDDDFYNVINHFEKPILSEHTIVVTSDFSDIKLAKLFDGQ
jgi:predicted kinase